MTADERELKDAEERATFWEDKARAAQRHSDYYRDELAKAHAILGRVVHQASERWDSVRLTSFFPTDNLYSKRSKE